MRTLWCPLAGKWGTRRKLLICYSALLINKGVISRKYCRKTKLACLLNLQFDNWGQNVENVWGKLNKYWHWVIVKRKRAIERRNSRGWNMRIRTRWEDSCICVGSSCWVCVCVEFVVCACICRVPGLADLFFSALFLRSSACWMKEDWRAGEQFYRFWHKSFLLHVPDWLIFDFLWSSEIAKVFSDKLFLMELRRVRFVKTFPWRREGISCGLQSQNGEFHWTSISSYFHFTPIAQQTCLGTN